MPVNRSLSFLLASALLLPLLGCEALLNQEEMSRTPAPVVMASASSMPMPPDVIEAYIKEAFPDAQITLVDTAGDQDHYDLTVVSPAFAGKSRIEQHKMVYAALKGHMTTTLHALKLTTKAS